VDRIAAMEEEIGGLRDENARLRLSASAMPVRPASHLKVCVCVFDQCMLNSFLIMFFSDQ
jgi:hypothetical protein